MAMTAGFRGFAVASFMAAAMFLTPVVEAKSINDYNAMTTHDQSRYVNDLLNGAKVLLQKQGRSDVAMKITTLFTEVEPGNILPPGNWQFMKDLEAGEQYQQKTGKTLQVEHALLVTFKKLGIEVPQEEFMHLGDKFKPVDPPTKK